MSAVALLLTVALAADPQVEPTSSEAPVTQTSGHTDVEVMAQADVVALIRSLREEVRAQGSEIQALREAKPNMVDTGTPASGGPLVIAVGQKADSAVGIGQDVHIRGHVLGDVTAIGANVRIFSTGSVDGDATAVGGVVRVDDGGDVHGNRVMLARDDLTTGLRDSSWAGIWASLIHRLVLFLSFAGAGILVVALFPDRVARVAKQLTERPVGSLASGTIGAGVLLLGSLLFAITVIGLPVSVVLMGLFGLAWLLGFVGLCQAVGDRLPMESKVHGRWLAFVGGSTLVAFLGSLPVLGILVVGATSALGMGAAFSTRFGTR